MNDDPLMAFACICLTIGVIMFLVILGIIAYSLGTMALLTYISIACIVIGCLIFYLEEKAYDM